MNARKQAADAVKAFVTEKRAMNRKYTPAHPYDYRDVIGSIAFDLAHDTELTEDERLCMAALFAAAEVSSFGSLPRDRRTRKYKTAYRGLRSIMGA